MVRSRKRKKPPTFQGGGGEQGKRSDESTTCLLTLGNIRERKASIVIEFFFKNSIKRPITVRYSFEMLAMTVYFN